METFDQSFSDACMSRLGAVVAVVLIVGLAVGQFFVF